MKWIAIGLLAAAPALAEAPGSSIHFGVGAYWTIPVDSYGSASNYYRGSAWIPTRQDRALSLDLSYEFHNAFVALDVAFGGFSAGLPWFRMFSARGGYVFGSGPIAPYLSAGLGYLTQDDGRWCNPFYDNCSDVSGAAVLAEAGVLFFRDLAHGRVALVGQLIEPLFSHSRLYPTPLHETLRTVVLGLRVLY